MDNCYASSVRVGVTNCLATFNGYAALHKCPPCSICFGESFENLTIFTILIATCQSKPPNDLDSTTLTSYYISVANSSDIKIQAKYRYICFNMSPTNVCLKNNHNARLTINIDRFHIKRRTFFFSSVRAGSHSSSLHCVLDWYPCSTTQEKQVLNIT